MPTHLLAAPALILCLSAIAPAAPGHGPARKLITYGWDSMDERQLEAAAGDLQHLPFDGLSVLNGHYVHTFHNRDGLDDDTIEAAVRTMSRIPWGRFTDNFMYMFSGAHSQWFDDAAWADDGHIIRNVRTLARMGRAGGCRGIIFDPEFITPGQEREAGPWNYEHQALHTEKSFEAYRAQVSAAHAIFVDLHSNSRDAHTLSTYMTPQERATGMERIVYLALKHSDRYVWFYTQKPRYLHNDLVEPLMIPAILRAKRKVAANEPLGFDWEPIERRAGDAYHRAQSGDIVPLATTVARATTSLPKLDGRLDDEIWTGASRLGPFQSFLTSPHPLTAQAKAYMAYDDTNLYVAFRCDIKDKRTKFDATDIARDNEQRGRGDLVEIGIAADETASAYLGGGLALG